MDKRMRPVTYAEALEAKKAALANFEETQKKLLEKENPIVQNSEVVTSINSIKIDDLPSGGKNYPEKSAIYYTPFSFGEMKYLSGSSLSDVENIDFFMGKIQCTFPKEDLTYYDFYFISIMIKMATFGEVEYNMNFECGTCGHLNTIPFKSTDLDFDEIRVTQPIIMDLKTPYNNTETGEKRLNVLFVPISIGRYKKMLKDDKIDDYDIHMANCIKDGSEEERIELIKEYMVGTDINLLETIDVSLYHGVKDMEMKCQNKISSEDSDDEEVCGRVYAIPFHNLSEHISSTDECKESLGQRIHFGV